VKDDKKMMKGKETDLETDKSYDLVKERKSK